MKPIKMYKLRLLGFNPTIRLTPKIVSFQFGIYTNNNEIFMRNWIEASNISSV